MNQSLAGQAVVLGGGVAGLLAARVLADTYPHRHSRTREESDMVEIVKREPSAKGVAERLTGDVWFDNLAFGVGPSRLRINIGHLAPGTRTLWYRHAVGQTLNVANGVRLGSPAAAHVLGHGLVVDGAWTAV